MKRFLSMAVAMGFCLTLVSGVSAGDDSGIPSWLKDVNFKGKFRIRAEKLRNDNQPGNFLRDRNRLRYLARYGFDFRPDEGLKIGFRVGSSGTTGAQPGVGSQFVTMDDGFRDDPLYVDLAYASYWPGVFPALGMEITAGKFNNPYTSTGIIWDSDIGPEGIYVKLVPPSLKSHKISLTSGYLVLQENNSGGGGTTASGIQIGRDAYGLAHQINAGGLMIGSIEMSGWATLYNWIRPSLTQLAQANMAFGNNSNDGNRYTSEFNIIDVGLKASYDVIGYPASLTFNYMKNDNAVANPGTGKVEDRGMVLKSTLGKIEMKGDWAIKSVWSRIETDALLAFLMDATYFSVGSTNYEGYAIGLTYALTDHSTIAVNFYDSEEENKAGADPDQQTLQINYSVSF
ncbi:MAG: putative porin [Candidatus Lindowbacteria bacterium]|nr:putative porin [Candidatus Lindowbacteria bacterium]